MNNDVVITGVVAEDPVLSHEVVGEKLYNVTLGSQRTSGTVDLVPLMISDRHPGFKKVRKGVGITVTGSFRSFNKWTDGKSKLLLYVFVDKIEDPTGGNDNTIRFVGFIVKKPIFRVTPKGRSIADMIFAVNRQYGRTDYIPCICWGRNAEWAERLEVGTCMDIRGRVQSREYEKVVEDKVERRIAYEVSIVNMLPADA